MAAQGTAFLAHVGWQRACGTHVLSGSRHFLLHLYGIQWCFLDLLSIYKTHRLQCQPKCRWRMPALRACFAACNDPMRLGRASLLLQVRWHCACRAHVPSGSRCLTLHLCSIYCCILELPCAPAQWALLLLRLALLQPLCDALQVQGMPTDAPDHGAVVAWVLAVGWAAIVWIAANATNVIACVPGPVAHNVPLLDVHLERHAGNSTDAAYSPWHVLVSDHPSMIVMAKAFGLAVLPARQCADRQLRKDSDREV